MSAAIGRLDLFIVVRNQLAERVLTRRALAVEAVMEELARATGADAELWGIAGLGADIDCKLTAGNPLRRGEVAEELLLAEGVAPEAAAAARTWRQGRVAELTAMARGLVAAQLLVTLVAGELAEPGVTLDDLTDGRVDHRLRRLARREDAEAARVLEALAALGVTPAAAGALAVAAHLRVREDLGL